VQLEIPINSITSFPDYSIVTMNPIRYFRRPRRHSGEQGYILLTLLLIIALGIIFTAAIIPSITFNIRRDREEEMVHRGTQYSRAIRTFYKKFGRYPTKLEDLESTNNMRFLRKRYKDPMTGQDFKLLHFGEVQLALSGALGGGGIQGASSLNGNGGLSGPSTFGQSSGQSSTLGGSSSFGGNSSFGANSNSSFGQNSQQPNSSGVLGGDPTQAGSTSSQTGSSQPGGAGQPNSTNGSGDSLTGVTFGGGPIVGVASNAKCPPRPKDECEGYREYNHKKKYNEWQFIYDPATDRGGLITTPNQPQIQAFGQQGTPNLNGSSAFGTGQPPSGMQNNPNLPTSGGFGGGFGTAPQQPSSPPPQQQ
jgi:type II secretory pathway pseudopilin PulG